MMKYVGIILLVLGFGLIQSCKNTNLERLKEEFYAKQISDPNSTTHKIDTSKVISFKEDIMFIMKTECGSNDNLCHSPQSVASKNSSVGLFDYDGVKASQDPDGLLYSSVIWDGNANEMPRKSKTQIDPLYIVAIKKWIDNGMLNN